MKDLERTKLAEKRAWCNARRYAVADDNMRDFRRQLDAEEQIQRTIENAASEDCRAVDERTRAFRRDMDKHTAEQRFRRELEYREEDRKAMQYERWGK